MFRDLSRWFGVLLLGPFFSAVGAGVRQGQSADVAAAVGTSLSLIVVAGTLDPAFRPAYEAAWSATPLLGVLPAPSAPLFPGFLADATAPAVAGFAVAADGLLLVALAAVAVVSLLLRAGEWEDETFAGMLLTALAGMAGAAFGLPVGSVEGERDGSDGGGDAAW